MVKERKTIDTWQIHVNYGYGDGWEHECTEFDYRTALEQLKAYRDNCPYPVKVIKRRAPKPLEQLQHFVEGY